MAGNNKNGIYLRFNFPDKNTVKRDLMNLLKETNGTVDLKFDFPSVTQIQQKLQQILNEATMGLNVNTEHWIDTQRIGANLDKVRQQLLIISYQVSQAFNLSQIDTNGLAKFAQGLENIGNKASSVQQVKTAIDGVYSSCKTTTQAISQFMNTEIGVNIDPSKKVLSVGSNLGKELNQQLREAFNNKDIDSFVKSAQNAYSKGIEKSLSQSVGKDTLNQLKTQYKTLIDQISGTKISIKNIGISKEAEAQLRQSIRGYAKIDNVNGTSLDSMVGEWKNISQQNGLNLFNTGNMEDAINDLSRFISEYKNLKKGVLPSSVNSLGFNEMAEEEQLEKVKQEAIKLYQALENINASKQKNQNTPISNTSDSQQIRKTVEDIERENRELEKIKAIKTEINNSNFKNNSLDFDKSYYSLQARAKEIQQTMRGITSISFSKSPTGEQELSKAVIKYKNELGQVVTETMGWKNITDETGNVISKVFTTLGNLRIVDNIGTQEKQLDKLKNKILELQNSGQFQSAPIKSLFNRLEKIDLTNIQKAEQGITNLQQSVERFSNNQPKIKSLANIKQQVEQLKASLKNENTDIFSNIMNGKEGTKLTTLMKQLETQFTSLRKGSGTFNTGDIDKTVQNVKNQMAVLQREFNKNIGIDTMINKAQTALSRLGDKSALLDSGALKKFQDQFNSFSTKTSVDQIQKFIDEVNRISKNGDQINKIDSQLNKLQTNLMKLKIENGTDYLTNDKTISYFNELKGKIEELKKAQEQLRNGQYIDPTSIKNLQDRVSNAYQQMTAQAKAFRDANRGNGNNLTNTNTGKYDNLVTAFNNLNKTNLSDSFVKQLDEQIKKLGQDLSQSGVADKIKELKATITNVKGNSKQFDTLNNKLKDMTLNLSNVKSKYKDGVIPSSATNALNNYQRAMSELQSSMQKLASGQKIENITPITSNATRAMRQLNRETGNTILTQRNLGTTIQNTLSKFGIYTSMAIACRRLFQEIKEGVQYVKYLDESFTDMSMTMSGLTRTQFDEMGQQLDEMANKIGNTIESVHDIGRIFSNEQTSTEEILAKTKPTAELSSIAGMDALTASKNMQDIANQFKLLEDEGTKASDVFTHIGDVMTSVSKNMTYDFASGIQELSSAISTSGSMAKMSGDSLESFVATMGALIEQTGKNGAELANAYRFIGARVLQIKQLSDEMGISEEDSSKAKIALDKLGISREVEGQPGKLKGLTEILTEVHDKWGSLTEAQKQYTSEMLAGNQRRSIFISWMESMTQQQELYNKALNSTGALEEANSVKAESLEGKINKLSNTTKQMWSSFINSDMIKGAIDGLTTLIEKFGNLPTIIGLATTALIAFKGKAIATFLTSLPAMISQIVAYQTALGATSTATALLSHSMNSLKMAFMSNPFGLLGIAIGLTVTQISMLKTSLDEVAEGIDKMKESTSELKTISDQESLAKQYESLQNKLKNENLSTEEAVEVKKELLSVQEQLAKQFPNLVSGFDKEGNAIVTNLDKVNKVIEEAKKKALVSLKDGYKTSIKGIESEYVGNNWADKLGEWIDGGKTGIKWIDDKETGIENWIKHPLLKYNKEIVELFDKTPKNANLVEMYQYYSKIDDLTDKQSKDFANIKEKLKDFNSQVETIYSTTKDLNELKGLKYFNVETGELVDAEEYFKEMSGKVDENTKSLEDNADAQKDLSESSETLKKQIENLADAFSNLTSEIDVIDKVIEEMQKYGGITSSTYATLLKDHPEVIKALMKEGDTIQNLTELREKDVEKQKKAQEDAINNILNTDFDEKGEPVAKTTSKDSSASQKEVKQIQVSKEEVKKAEKEKRQEIEKTKNTQLKSIAETSNAYENYNSLKQNQGSIVDNSQEIKQIQETSNQVQKSEEEKRQQQENTKQQQEKNYAEVTSIYDSYSVLKQNSDIDFHNSMRTNASDTVSELSNHYIDDAKNFENAEQAKRQSLANTKNFAEKVNGIGEIVGESVGKSGGVGSTLGTVLEKINQATQEKQSQEDNKNKIDDLLAQYNNSSPTLINNKEASEIDETLKNKEKDYSVEDVEDLTDAYHDLNNAITLVEAKLKQLQARYENLYGKSKAQAMQEQVDILRQQLDLHSQMESKINSELAKQRSELASQGVTFDSSGMISNYNEILTSLRNQANAIQTVDENSKKAKENAKTNLTDLQKKMNDYNSTITKDLEEQKTTWLELQNQIKETYKTMEKMVTDGESKVTDVIKSEIDKRKEKEKEAVEEELKQIDKVKEALQDQWDTDDYEDQLQEAQDKVMEYEEKIREAIKNGDMNSLTDLKKEQQDALKELNDTVKQHERDMINDEIDDQSDALNKKSEEIDKKYEEMEKSENLTKMVTEALQTGFFKINDEVISLSSAMSDFVKESTVGIGTINQTTRELNQTLADTLAMLNQLGGYNGLTNLLPNVPYQMLANNTGTIDRNTVFTDSGNNTRSISIKLGDMYVNGNLDNVTLEDVNNTISKRFKEVVGNYIS